MIKSLVALLLCIFIGSVSHAESPRPREIELIVDEGYKPSTIDVAPGEAVRLKITRKDYSPCTQEIVFPTLDIKRELPVNKPVFIDIPARDNGATPFHCGMRMFKGSVVVKAR